MVIGSPGTDVPLPSKRHMQFRHPIGEFEEDAGCLFASTEASAIQRARPLHAHARAVGSTRPLPRRARPTVRLPFRRESRRDSRRRCACAPRRRGLRRADSWRVVLGPPTEPNWEPNPCQTESLRTDGPRRLPARSGAKSARCRDSLRVHAPETQHRVVNHPASISSAG